MTLTITIHAWFVLVYLGIGVILWYPLHLVAQSKVTPKRLRVRVRYIIGETVLWPLWAWEVLRA